MDSSFSPEQFLGAALTQPLTKRPPAPAGRPFDATIGTPKFRHGVSEKDPMNPRSWVAMDVPLEIELPADVATTVGQAKITLTDSVFLDVGSDGKSLDMSPGRNRGLRRYYDATGLNKPGTTPGHLPGNRVKVVLSHDVAKDGSGDLYERVAGITKA